MGMNVNINGSLSITILDYSTKQPINETNDILTKLQQGKYIIGLASGMIYDIDDLINPLYHFEFEVNEDTEYEFEEIE